MGTVVKIMVSDHKNYRFKFQKNSLLALWHLVRYSNSISLHFLLNNKAKNRACLVELWAGGVLYTEHTMLGTVPDTQQQKINAC